MDFEKLFNDILEAMKGEIKEDWPKAKGYLKQIIENNKGSLIEITKYYLNGELTLEEYQTELEAEMKTVQTEMLALNVMKNKAIQDAVNAGIDIVMKAVKII